ncbi:MAG: SUMF1/EgtB/PvdO family nonheme iron enzyme [Planctomycetaceae bacterium]
MSLWNRKFQPNGFGLWHMSGNIREYTRSERHESVQDAIKHKTSDLAHGSAEARRCVRGGSGEYAARNTRCSDRRWSELRAR